MTTRTAAADLQHSVAFDSLSNGSDGHGGTTAAWVQQFACRAGFRHLRGGEAVQAARLAGRHVQIVTVRASDAARLATANWRVRDLRTGDVFNIRDVTETADRRFIEFLCEKGVAA